MIRLETFHREDYDRLISWVDTAETLLQFAGPALHFPLTAAQLDANLADPARTAFRVVMDKTMIGYAELYETAAAVFLGRILIGSSEHRGKGAGLQIVQQLLDHLFSHTDKAQAALNVYDWNTAAIRCYEQAGFRTDPDKKTESSVNGQTWTAIRMTIGRDTWLQRRS